MENIKKDLIIEAYKQVLEEKKVIPSIENIINRINYNIDRRALDWIYEIKQNSISEEEVFEVIKGKDFTFTWRGEIYNPVEVKLF